MIRRITQLSNFIALIENGIITITDIQCKTKACTDITETDYDVTPEKFIESIQFLNETLFKDALDFYYEYTGKNNLSIKCGAKNPYLDQYFYVDCMIQDGISVEDIDLKLRETAFKE